MFSSIWRDLACAGRSLAKARAFTLVCVVSLGIGMVPVIAVPYASRVFNLMLTPPGVQTDGLVEVVTTPSGPRQAVDIWSYPDFVDLRAADMGLALTGWANGTSRFTTETPAGAQTRALSAAFVSANYFETFGVSLAQGRTFTDAMDDPLLVDRVVILGHDFWQHDLGADANIIGAQLILDGAPHVVVGVAPPLAIDARQVIMPLERHPRLHADEVGVEPARTDRRREWIHIHGRLRPGVSVTHANAAVAVVTSQLARLHPATNEFRAGSVASYDPVGVLQRPQIRLLQGVALTLTGVVLLVVCLNISGMMLVRWAMRERELSVRQAIGASRGRLMQGLLSEAIVLAAIGAALAALVLINVPPLVMWLSGETLPARFHESMRFDAYMLVVCVAACIVTSLMCGLMPAMRFSRPAILAALKDDAGAGGIRAGRLHRLTAALQVAIAVPLIVMAGISLDRIRATAMNDLGFAAEDLSAAQIGLDDVSADQAAFRIRTAMATLAQARGVASVTVADGLPLDFSGRSHGVSLQAERDAAPRTWRVHVTRVGDDYLETMAIPLWRGRGIVEDDRTGAERVTVISKTLADALLPEHDAADVLGRHLIFDPEGDTPLTLTIVGVTADFPTSQMSTERSQLLVPLAQHPAPAVFLIARRTPGESAATMAAALEATVRDLVPDDATALTMGEGIRYARVVTGTWLREHSVRDFVGWSIASGSSGGVILMLAALGIYGVVGLMVAARTREIAVRVALGASRRRVIAMILFDVVKLAMPGIVVGIVLTVGLMRLNAENMGIALSDVESLAYVGGAAVALIVALVASLPPARRAATIAPMIAMRSE